MASPSGKDGEFTTHQLEEISSQLAYYSTKIRAIIGVMQAHDIDQIVTKNASGPERARAIIRRWLHSLDIAVEELIVSSEQKDIVVTIGTESKNAGTKQAKNKQKK